MDDILVTLFSAYSRREVQLLTLDGLTDERTSSAGLIEAWHADRGLDGLDAAFVDWERGAPTSSTATPPTRCWPSSAGPPSPCCWSRPSSATTPPPLPLEDR